MNKSKKRLTVGLLMLLVAVVAIALWAVDYSRRIRVVFDNRSPSQVSDLTVTYAGRARHLGPVRPRSKVVVRVPAPGGEPVRVGWEVQGPTVVEDRRIQAPAVSHPGPGGVVLVGWDG